MTKTAIPASWSAPGPTSPRASRPSRRRSTPISELQDTKRYLTRLIESSTDAIVATDKDGKVVLFNEGAETLLGYRAAEVIGRPSSELYASEEHAKDVLREMRKRGGTVAGFDSMLKTKDGTSIPVLISASVLYGDRGEEMGTVGFATDLRTRKHEEEELRKAHDELEKRVDERTTELKAARERLRYLMTVTPAIVYTNQAERLYLHLRERERLPHHGLLRLGDAGGQGFLDGATASRGCHARVRGDGAHWSKKAAGRSSTASATATGIISGSRTRSA